MKQLIVLDAGAGQVYVFLYNEETYPDCEVLLHELADDDKISSVENCNWIVLDEEHEIEYETI